MFPLKKQLRRGACGVGFSSPSGPSKLKSLSLSLSLFLFLSLIVKVMHGMRLMAHTVVILINLPNVYVSIHIHT